MYPSSKLWLVPFPAQLSTKRECQFWQAIFWKTLPNSKKLHIEGLYQEALMSLQAPYHYIHPFIPEIHNT